ncbi:MAG: hypothetical protein JEZ04_18035 [Spirochaetales bacterium]|nr:hypothetical protein [Spirochaetales bacterium]
MNQSMKNRIISELDGLPDQKVDSLLDYLHFLKLEHYPNKDTVKAIKEVENARDNLQAYDSADDLFDDLGIDS